LFERLPDEHAVSERNLQTRQLADWTIFRLVNSPKCWRKFE